MTSMMAYYIWFYTIFLSTIVFASSPAKDILFHDKELYKYENEQLEREAFTRINSWLLKHAPSTTLEESVSHLKGLMRKSKNSLWTHKLTLASILLSNQPFDSVAKYVVQAIKQLKASTLIDDSNRCNPDANRLLLRIFKGLFWQDGARKVEDTRLKQLMVLSFRLHSIQCYDLYPQKYAEIMDKIPMKVKKSVDYFLNRLVDIRFVDKQVSKDEVAVRLLEALRAVLPTGERMFDDRTIMVEYVEKYDKNLARLKELLERHLKCREYYQALGPELFELVEMDSFFLSGNTQVPDPLLADFYQSWSKVRICKWIAERTDRMASNMMFWAVFEWNEEVVVKDEN